MKKFVLGFLTAALLFTALPIGAAVQQYVLQPTAAKIVVDGAEVKDDNLPIMSYQGYNYIPAAVFRNICDKIGVGFKWDNEKKEIQITTTAPAEATTSSGGVNMEVPEKITQTPDGITMIDTWEGKQYIGIGYIQQSINKKGYDIVPNIKQKKGWLLIKGNSPDFKFYFHTEESEYTVILNDLPTTYAYGGDNIEVNYYINTILPLIK